MIVTIRGKVYRVVPLHELSIRHRMQLQRELQVHEISAARTWKGLVGLVSEFAGLSKAEREDHPEGLFLYAVMIWSARVGAGEDISLLDAVDFTDDEAELFDEPGDERPNREDVRPGKSRAGGGLGAGSRSPAKARRKRRPGR